MPEQLCIFIGTIILVYNFYRHPTANFILKGGQSSTWLVGTKLVTVSTSGCTLKPFRNGLCDKCSHSCYHIEDDHPDDPVKFVEKIKLAVSQSFNKEASDQHDGNTTTKEAAPSSYLSTATSSPREESKTFSQVESTFEKTRKNSFSERYGDIKNCICWCQSWAEITVKSPAGINMFNLFLLNVQTFNSYL